MTYLDSWISYGREVQREIGYGKNKSTCAFLFSPFFLPPTRNSVLCNSCPQLIFSTVLVFCNVISCTIVLKIVCFAPGSLFCGMRSQKPSPSLMAAAWGAVCALLKSLDDLQISSLLVTDSRICLCALQTSRAAFIYLSLQKVGGTSARSSLLLTPFQPDSSREATCGVGMRGGAI